MRGRRKWSRAFGTLLLLGGVLLANGLPNGWANDSAPKTSSSKKSDAKNVALPTWQQTTSELESLTPPPPKRLLVIAPHPDDASLGGAAMIARTLSSGGTVRLVVMTSGDGFRTAAAKTFDVQHPQPHDMYRLGLVRQQEELHAACELGLLKQDVQFLGYPDGGLQQLWSNSHWTPNAPYRGLNGYTYVPYPRALRRGAPYCGQAVVDDLTRVITKFQPTDVLLPDPHDIHNDHWATHAFTQYVLAAMHQPTRTWHYLIHYPDFPVPRYYEPQRPLEPPQSMTCVGVNWLHLPVLDSLQTAKERAVRSHQTQIKVMSDLLLAFIRPNELIGVYAPQNIPEQRNLTDPFGQTNTALPYRVVTDQVHDQQPHFTKFDAGDIREVAVVRTPDHLHICVEMSGEIRPDLDYELHLRLPDVPPTLQKRLDFRIRAGKLIGNSHDVDPALSSVQLKRRRFILSLPSASFRQAHVMLLSAEVSQNRHPIDKTAWQTLHFQTTTLP